jgi:uncharacterized ion transporter superfamily protein YfcC
VAEDPNTGGSPPGAETGESPAGGGPGKRRKFKFPSAFTVLTLVALLIWGLTWVIPAGQYELDDEGAPIPGTYEEIEAPLGFVDRVEDFFLAPVNGLYGIESTETGFIDGDEEGFMFGAAQVFLFVLAIGVFITVMFETGALNRGIAQLAYRTRARGWLMIVAIMVVFSILGSVEGMAEETLGFYALIVPLMLALGYDRMVAVGVILIGATVGVYGSTVNPFSIGIASGFADVSIGDGIVLRLLLWALLTAVGIAFVVRYANRVRSRPETSVVGFAPGDREQAEAAAEAAMPEPLSGRDKITLAATVLTFAFMIFAIVPWASIIEGTDAEPYSWELGWWFPQLTAMFIVAAVIVGLIGGLSESRLTDTIVKGAGDFLYPALVIVLARGISVIMSNNEIADTVLHAMESAATDVTGAIFAPVIFVLNLPLAFLIPSTSGHATLAMPILAPLGDFADVDRSLVVTSWNAASGWINLITPTSGVVMGGLALAKVGYDRYLRWIAPLMLILFLITVIAMAIAGAAQ